MGAKAKGIANTIGRGASGIFTLGGSEIARNNLGQKNVINQVANAPGTIVTGGQSTYANPFNPGMGGPNNPYISGPFSLDPAQMAADKSDILNLGNTQFADANSLYQKQYNDLLSGIDTNTSAQTQRAKDLFGQMLPNIAENSQAAHLYDSTGYGQEVARQQSDIASQLASQAAQERLGALQGLQGNQASALQGRQGFETGALQRGQSLEDFINQANVAKSIGAQMAPIPPSGKQNFGTVAQGVGALAPWARVGKGAATGGVPGAAIAAGSVAAGH